MYTKAKHIDYEWESVLYFIETNIVGGWRQRTTHFNENIMPFNSYDERYNHLLIMMMFLCLKQKVTYDLGPSQITVTFMFTINQKVSCKLK